MFYENQYKVKTDWGWITLDEASYRDYLEGKLWISTPRRSAARQTSTAAPQPQRTLQANVSEEAHQLRDLTAKYGVYSVLQQIVPGGEVEVPYRSRMNPVKTEEMNLSVRSANCLMRAGASSMGKLCDLMSSGRGLRSVRNLGAKSEKEIRLVFFATCYSLLRPGEQAIFWQKTLDARREKRDQKALFC